MSQRGRVLIVDDDELMQRAMRRAATEAGLECIAVLDGALANERRRSPSVGLQANEENLVRGR